MRLVCALLAVAQSSLAADLTPDTPILTPHHLLLRQVDLWSLGVILYELFVGQPPFYTNSIYSLIHHIVKDPVKFPTNISPEFKSFLKGLLNKKPADRWVWDQLGASKLEATMVSSYLFN
jgi:serine/threonine protein kinase